MAKKPQTIISDIRCASDLPPEIGNKFVTKQLANLLKTTNCTMQLATYDNGVKLLVKFPKVHDTDIGGAFRLTAPNDSGLDRLAITVVGYKLAGLPGILVSVLGAVIPPFVILTVISFFYTAFKSSFIVRSLLTGMKAGVAAVIMSVVYDMGSGIMKAKDPVNIILMILAFIANYYFHVNVIFIILAAALLGLMRTLPAHLNGKARK